MSSIKFRVDTRPCKLRDTPVATLLRGGVFSFEHVLAAMDVVRVNSNNKTLSIMIPGNVLATKCHGHLSALLAIEGNHYYRIYLQERVILYPGHLSYFILVFFSRYPLPHQKTIFVP